MNTFANYLIENNRNLDEVSELMDRAMELAQNKVDYYNYSDMKGWSLYKQGKNQEALDILQKTWDSAPFKLYSIYSHLEEVEKAVGRQ
jgi:tetratricopeptide (TPR) repeat protein